MAEGTALSVESLPPPGAKGLPLVGDLLEDAAHQVEAAARELWPYAAITLGSHVPSVTGFVCRVRVGERELFAKLSYLGLSLVSVLRGAGGDWDTVRQEQWDYRTRPDALLAREASQLRLLSTMSRPKVCQVAGHAHGVLFTDPVEGATLGQLLLAFPDRAGDLLTSAYGQLEELHARPVVELGPRWAISERSVIVTFRRKFNGLSGRHYLDQLGSERVPEAERAAVVSALSLAVGRMRRLLPAGPAKGRALVYGDLKPEHVFFPNGLGEEPVFVDPGLAYAAGPQADAAKLISRTMLLIAAARRLMGGCGRWPHYGWRTR